MRAVLGIDYGRKRIGLAASDDLGLTAQGLETLERTDPGEDIKRLAEVVKERGVEEIVVGRPLNLDGSAGQAAEETGEFARLLREELGVPVQLWDERLTTAQAERAMLEADASRRRRRRARDRMAAQIMLQSFLDARRRDQDA